LAVYETILTLFLIDIKYFEKINMNVVSQYLKYGIKNYVLEAKIVSVIIGCISSSISNISLTVSSVFFIKINIYKNKMYII